MKRISIILAISIISAAGITGCQKFDYDPSMTATIGTLAFNTVGSKNVIAHVDTFTHNPQKVIITGTSTVYTPGTSFLPVIKLFVPNAIGTYNIVANDTNKGAVIYTASTGITGTQAVSGQINVLNISKGKIQGNFTLTCADGTSVTAGQYIAVESFY
jgi:hypothetical protein